MRSSSLPKSEMLVWRLCLRGRNSNFFFFLSLPFINAPRANPFSSSLMVGVSEWGLKTCEKVQDDYNTESWTPLKRHFKNPNKQK